ncbi:MAG: hypothetical protein PF484_04255 [Bacteroidales bacterium]|jgi:hypothetical protein|nr:hypothetical protein [Bacteroidales bacterium]
MRFFSFYANILLFFSLTLFTACENNQFKVDVSDIPVPKIEIKDYGTALFSLNRDSLPQELAIIQKDFSLFLGTEPLIDEQIIQLSFYINDPLLNDLYKEYLSSFPSIENLENETANAFQYLLYYFPDSSIPEMYAYISGVHDPIIFQDNILVLGLDNYLGADCKIYARMGIPRYKIRTMTPQYVLRDVFSALSLEKIKAPPTDGTVLEYMIYEAKKLFFVRSMLPVIDDSILLRYTVEQLSWFNEKEKALWKYYIENELLFKTDYESLKKFINDAPFTSVLGNDSPPRTGVWLGYKILLAYAKNNEVSLSDILSNNNAQEILNKSKYKPGR